MPYRLRYTYRAIRELNAAADWIAQHAPETAEIWFDQFIDKLSQLQFNPNCYGFAPENERSKIVIRQLLFLTASRQANRALFTISGNEVVILGIRRPGQDIVPPGELHVDN